MDVIANILGYVIRFIYHITSDNYALSIILFAILTKLVLFPLNLKQTKSTLEIQKVKPKYDEIMKKYKNDKVKQSEEITKLYSEHKINPMGGCLPLLIQLPLIFAMFSIVRQPLTYVARMPKDEIKIYAQQMLQKEEVNDAEISNLEIEIAKKYDIIDMNLFGLNLGDTPSNSFNKDEEKRANPVSILIPILSVILSIYQIKQSQKSMEMSEEQKEMQKSMNLMMPILSGSIAYTTPLALGIYWLLGSVMQILQQAMINNIVKEKDESKDPVNLLSDSNKGRKK